MTKVSGFLTEGPGQDVTVNLVMPETGYANEWVIKREDHGDNTDIVAWYFLIGLQHGVRYAGRWLAGLDAPSPPVELSEREQD